MDVTTFNQEVFYAIVVAIGFWTMLMCLRAIAGEIAYHEERCGLLVRAHMLRQEQQRKLDALEEDRRQRSKPTPTVAPADEHAVPVDDEVADDVTFTQPGVEQPINAVSSSKSPARAAA